MAKRANSGGVSKSEEIRNLLREDPEVDSKTAVAKLAEKGITISNALFYFVKGQIKGRKARRNQEKGKARTRASANMGGTISLSSISKVKALAFEVGGMAQLKALVDALND